MENNEQVKRVSENKKSVKWFAFIRPTLLLLTTVFLFTYVSFAWMRREWTPFVEQSGITIATGGSLAFQLDEDAQLTTATTINSILGVENFILKPVSNLDGKSDSFFTLDLQKTKGEETYKKLNISTYGGTDYTLMGKENGYIEFKLLMYSAGSKNNDRYVYIADDSFIGISNLTPEKADVLECIRVSISTSTGKTWIFAPEDENGILKVKNHQGVSLEPNENGGYLMDGVKYYALYDPDSSDNPANTTYNGVQIVEDYDGTLYGFSDWNGENDDGSVGNIAKSLFRIQAGEAAKEWLTVRIWAEGTHEKCTKEISNAQIDLKLKFSSFTVAANNSTEATE